MAMNTTPDNINVDDQLEEIIVRLHGTHGVAHEMINGKSVGFVYCPHCKEAKAQLHKLLVAERIDELNSFDTTWHSQIEKKKQNRIEELQAQLTQEPQVGDK